ncbi:uncharacterized protein LOC129778036 [Toxorhynchites rutilus septentrionalis]|uniref:uncharacterized protein LOC129778036 n=1 Tax=Toxorhynchites rutilus septentrionalis TaxID=329112 RepID=UPI00247A28A5|nr:uncharacterized protein LOC129778036 [Toxorhynchites rutilus septentrionalis]
MKFALVFFAIFVLAHGVQGRPCDEDSSASSEERIVRVPESKPVPVEEEDSVSVEDSGFKPSNIIDGPVVCPEGQKPDHKGKCREVWGRKAPSLE